MVCPKCNGINTCAPKTTQRWRGSGTLRTVVCNDCGERFQTVEVSREAFEKISYRNFRKQTEKFLEQLGEMLAAVKGR
jgi:transcriptional regulator NrdR family protein